MKTAPMPAPRGLRGVALVEHVIAEFAAGRLQLLGYSPSGELVTREPAPLTPEQLAGLTLAGGAPLPPSLRRWLAFDAKFFPSLPFVPSLIEKPDRPALEPRRLPELVGPTWAPSFQNLAQELLTGAFYVLAQGSDSTFALYVGQAGQPDALGEYPVLDVRTDDEPNVTLLAPGFDVWLALRMNTLDLEGARNLFDYAPYASAMEEQARLNLAGHRALEANEWTHYDSAGNMRSDLPEPEPISTRAGTGGSGKKKKKKRK